MRGLHYPTAYDPPDHPGWMEHEWMQREHALGKMTTPQ
jgi:hypothetical protein